MPINDEQTKRFPLRVVLTVTTHRLLTKGSEGDNGIGDLYDILNWMTNDNLFTHQLPRATRECEPWLLQWFTELAAVNEHLPLLDKLLGEGDGETACQQWLAVIKVRCQLHDEYDIPRIPADDHVVKNAYDELVEMRGTDEGIVLLDTETGSMSE